MIRGTTLVLCACALACHRDLPGNLDQVTVGVSALRISLPVFVAKERDLFRRHGLEVTLRSFDTAQPLADAVATGELEAGGFVAYPIAFLSGENSEAPPSVATSLIEDREHRLSYVLAPPGSSLRFPRDAAGKRIGILPTVAYQRWLSAILRAARIDAASVTVVPVAPPMQAQALASGAVDLLFTNDPMATRILAGKLGVLADDGPPCAARLSDPFDFGTFMVSAQLATRRPDVARRLIAVIDEAILAIRADPMAARRAMLPHVRPDERGFIDAYPTQRYLTSDEARATAAAEMARERVLGILERDSRVGGWMR